MDTYRMSWATQRWMARTESSCVRAPATSSLTLACSSGEATYRDLALSAYHLPIAAHVVGDDTYTDMYTLLESAANCSGLSLGRSCVAQVYTRRPFETVSPRLKLRFSSST